MTKSDRETIQDWKRIDDENIGKICELIRSTNTDVREYLTEIVASLCEVDVDDMMTDTSKEYHSHVRWLLWYAYRYLTYDTYQHISDITESNGKRFAPQSITAGVNKMYRKITSNTVWTKRWAILKRIIKARYEASEFDFSEASKQIPTDRIFISIPREFKDKVEIKYED